MSFLDTLTPNDKEILEKILIIIRDKCPTAVKAFAYLETNTGKKATQALNNFRDVLFHLATTLKDIGKSADNTRNQLGAIEERLRRSIIEPYERAAITRLEDLEKLWVNYLETVPPYCSRIKPASNQQK
jgi:hypothetical protein